MCAKRSRFCEAPVLVKIISRFDKAPVELWKVAVNVKSVIIRAKASP